MDTLSTRRSRVQNSFRRILFSSRHVKILGFCYFVQIPSPSSSLFGGGGCGVRRVLRFCAQLTGESYYSTSWYMYSVLKKVLEYRYPLYRSTGTRFKKLFLSIVFTILKKSYFLNIQPVHLGFVCDLPPGPDVSQTKKNTGSLQRYYCLVF